MDALPTDVERALQHAIGQANSAFATGLPHTGIDSEGPQRKKGKKRAREDTSKGGEQPKEKKRKKKKHGHMEDSSVVPITDDSNIDPTLLNPATEIIVPVVEKKKTKKRKHVDVPSSEGPASTVSEPVDSAIHLSTLPDDSTTSTYAASLTSMMVEAGSSTSHPYYPPPAPPQEQPFPSSSPGADFPHQLNTNDDILRAFQDLDLTRLAGVLRNLDLPVSPSNVDFNSTDNPFASLLGPSGLPYGQDALSTATNVNTRITPVSAPPAQPRRANSAAGSSTVAKRPAKCSKSAPKQNPNLAAMGPSIANPEHTEMLATKWLNAAKLKELVETQGLVYKKGKFSAMEEQALKAAIENYRVTHGLFPEQITEVVFSKAKEENGSFWSEITASVPARPIIAVYHHVRRVYHPLKLQGKWEDAEDAVLVQGVSDLGQAWEKISEKVGRTAQDCRDRWRNHVAHRSERQKGHWSKEEEEELTRIVTEITTKQGKDSTNDVFWGIVSERMGNKRGRQQCRIKWTDALSKTVKNGGQNPRWNKQDAFILVFKVASMDVRDDSEIDWKLLPDADWNLWSAHSLQRRWRSLKHAIKGHEEMAFREIVDILKEKNAEVLGVIDVAAKSPRKEPKSAAVIEDEEGDQTRDGEGAGENIDSEEERE